MIKKVIILIIVISAMLLPISVFADEEYLQPYGGEDVPIYIAD